MRKSWLFVGVTLCLALAAALVGAKEAGVVSPTPPTTAPAPGNQKAFPEIPSHELHNAHRVTDKVLSGAQPESEAAFKELSELGVKTIISVDGAQPDAEAARKYGMRYVHLPIGYDGVPAEKGKAIAKALSELPGPVYVHCHHGKHRSAAAVAVACVMNGQLRPDQAQSVLETFGTGENYKGLWHDARAATRADDDELKSLHVDFVEHARISDLAEVMVDVDARFDHLKAIQKNGWQILKDHPDLDPPHEALQLEEHFREIQRTERAKDADDRFRAWLQASETAAGSLRAALLAKPANKEAADGAMKQLAGSCKACHEVHRD